MEKEYPIILHGDPKSKPLGVLVMGKRFSGKDTASNVLNTALVDQGVASTTTSTSYHLKKQYCQLHGLDLSLFLTDRAYKETHRPDFTEYVQSVTKEENLAIVQKDLQEQMKLFQVIIITDLRNHFDLEQISWIFPAFMTIRITCSEETRVARGYVPSSYDQSPFETELDDVVADYEIPNDGSMEDLRMRIEPLANALAETH